GEGGSLDQKTRRAVTGRVVGPGSGASRAAATLGKERRRKLARRGRPCDPPVNNAPVKEPYTVPVNTQAIGKQYEPTTYAVGREKIKEYARAVGETNPIHLDEQAARGVGYADVGAPPMFAVVYSSPSVAPSLFDPEVEMN